MSERENDPLGLVLGVLDDLFGGGARVHLLTDPDGGLVPLDSTEPTLFAPGPLHDALERAESSSWSVDVATLDRWDASYRSWLGRGGCHIVARRIEGGGAVVGTLSIVRSDDSRAPVVEDLELIQGLAGRLGRTSSVALARIGARGGAGEGPAPAPTAEPSTETRPGSGAPAGHAPSESAPATGGPERVPTDAGVPTGRHEEPATGAAAAAPEPGSGWATGARTGPAVDRGADQEPAAGGPAGFDRDEGFDEAGLTIGSIHSALALGKDAVEVLVRSRDRSPGLEARAMLGTLLHRLAPMLATRMPRSGLTVEVSRESGEWVLLVRPRDLEEAWPARPEIDPELEREASAMGAWVGVVARDRGGWLVEISVRDDVAEPAPPREPPAPVDLMSVSLADTEHMVMLALDRDHRVVFCNDELARRLESSVADLLGRPLSSANGSSRAFQEFDTLFARVDAEGLVQDTLAWPDTGRSGTRLRWTLSKSSSPETGEIYLGFGVDAEARPSGWTA